MPHYSFDVFDTLVGRNVASGKGVFAMLQFRLRQESDAGLPTYFVDDFITKREEAQKFAHERSAHPEVTLEEIYVAMGVQYPELQEAQLAMLRKREEALEVELAYGIPENLEKVLALIKAGERVILVSDMYLSKATVVRILEQAHPDLAQLPLYLSSEVKCRKSDGDLYRHVLEAESLQAHDLVHTGNDFHSDYLMARREGVRAELYEGAALRSLEAAYFREPGNIFLQLAVGASKRSRLVGYDRKPSFRLGSEFVGPIFYGFVYTLLRQAKAEGLKRVYFLARDGYLLRVIAEEIRSILNLEVEVDYLYVSRQSLYFASIFKVTESCLPWIFQRMDNEITLELVAKRVQFKVDDLLAHFPPELATSLRSNEADQALTPGQMKGMKEALLKDPDLKFVIEEKAAAYRKDVVAYFEQSGLLEEPRIGLVDIGWKGTLQDAIFRILRNVKPEIAITEYYFAVTHFSPYTSSANRKIPFCMFPSTRAGIGPVMELLLQCQHGTTLTYSREESGEVKPVLKDASQGDADWSVRCFKEGVEVYARFMCEALKELPDSEHCHLGIAPILIERLRDADPEIATTLGELNYSGDQEENRLRPMAPAFDFASALRYFFAPAATRAWMTQWFEGSFSRSSLPARILLSVDPRRGFKGLVARFVSRRQLSTARHRFRRGLRILRMRLGRLRRR